LSSKAIRSGNIVQSTYR